MIRATLVRVNAFGWGALAGYVAFRIEQSNRERELYRASFRAGMAVVGAAIGKPPR